MQSGIAFAISARTCINPYLFKSHPIANGKYKSHSLPVSADPSAPWERRKKEEEETSKNITPDAKSEMWTVSISC
jgi:hypothetical protein